MAFQFESLPNELFMHDIFPYLSLIDLNYAFVLLNKRFNKLVHLFLTAAVHHIHITSDTKWHEVEFTISRVLPYLAENHQFKTFTICHPDLFPKFLTYADRINKSHLNKIIVTPFIDIQFNDIIKFVSECFELNEIKLNILTNSDSSWANGRKWARWFETMQYTCQQNTLKKLEVCVWCINTNDAINFNPPLWDQEGIYRNNRNWKVQLKPGQEFDWRRARRYVEFSRSSQDFSALFRNQQNSNCIIS
ncbi:unnamed protein product [Rotaria socialis]|uniref:F-box domain-containing protein n=1 Tax=Rotaria socialis TaxID=392032 RepID=A0A820ND48_9BILA|nr:unnamed protein product [Rotaria socialis]CAF3461882.1 unnamed protein product [Rotaria socialis]CAF4343304.1 unnamed protein product [Rotaria socialis]CAF4385299.1 unnamed protein product [Rotaria socialis]